MTKLAMTPRCRLLEEEMTSVLQASLMAITLISLGAAKHDDGAASNAMSIKGGGVDRPWDTDKLLDGAVFRTGTPRGRHEVCGGLCFSPCGKYLAGFSADHTIRLWESTTGKLVHVLTKHEASVSTLRFSDDGGLLASGGAENVICLWDVKSGSLIRGIEVGQALTQNNTVLFTHDAQLLLSCDNFAIRFWNVSTGEQTREIKLRSKFTADSMDLSPDGRKLAVGFSVGPMQVRLQR